MYAQFRIVVMQLDPVARFGLQVSDGSGRVICAIPALLMRQRLRQRHASVANGSTEMR
jgi:hypothetical protein